MNEVERCPFCGSADVKPLTQTFLYDRNNNRGKRAVVCLNCWASVPGKNEEEAARKWNRCAGRGSRYEIMWKRLRTAISEVIIMSARANGKRAKARAYIEFGMTMDAIEAAENGRFANMNLAKAIIGKTEGEPK